MKITEDFIGNETKELTKTKIATILRWWGFNPDSYSTWGNARTDMNNILSGASSSTISDRERASSFLSKINYINDTDTVISNTLFAANEPGVWYDPSDLSTLYQDAAGTTPVTAVEQPVGLMLDKSKGLVLGPELVTNGTFDTDTNWTKVRGAVISEGAANIPATGYIFQVKNLQQGKFYLVTATISNYVVGSGQHVQYRYDYGGATTRTIFSIGRNGSFSGVLNIDYAPSGQGVFVESQSGSFTIDNISVRELPGNHAYQTTATSRPVLSARYNLLTKTEQFDDAVWAKNVVTVTPNTAIAPDGTLTADEVARNATGDASCISGATAVSSGASFAFSVYLKQSTARYAVIQLDSGSGAYFYADLQIGAVSQAPATYGATPPTSLSAAVVSIGNGWFRVVFSFTATSAVTTCWVKPITSGTGPGFNTADTVGASVFIWGADLRVANYGANLPPYQRVNTATDYDTSGFPHYLRFDGVDDWLVTPTITPGIDKVQVFAGVRKLSDAAGGILAELSVTSTANNGVFALFAPNAASTYALRSRGTTDALITSAASYASPITNVIAGLGDISGDLATLRVNGSQVAQNTTDQGTGNYLAYPLYIGRRGGTTMPFNGHLYGLIVRFGSNLPTATIEKTEKYINGLTKAY